MGNTGPIERSAIFSHGLGYLADCSFTASYPPRFGHFDLHCWRSDVHDGRLVLYKWTARVPSSHMAHDGTDSIRLLLLCKSCPAYWCLVTRHQTSCEWTDWCIFSKSLWLHVLLQTSASSQRMRQRSHLKRGTLEQLFSPIVPLSLLARDLQKWQQHFSFATE